MAHPIHELLSKGNLNGMYDVAKRELRGLSGLARSHRTGVELAAVAFGRHLPLSPEIVLSALKLSKILERMGLRQESARLVSSCHRTKTEFKGYFVKMLGRLAATGERDRLKRITTLVRSFFSDDPFFEIAHVIHAMNCSPVAVEASLRESGLSPSDQKAIFEQLFVFNRFCQGRTVSANHHSKYVNPSHLLPWAIMCSHIEFFSRYREWIAACRCTEAETTEIIVSLARSSAVDRRALLPQLKQMASLISRPAARLKLLHSIGIQADGKMTAGTFAEVSAPLRLRHLQRLHQAKEYLAIVDLCEGAVDRCGLDEALYVARAMAETGKAAEALDLVRQRKRELEAQHKGWQTAVLVANRAQAWADVVIFAKGALRDSTDSEGAVAALRHIAGALRRLRRIPRVQRLGSHLTWRYSQGRLPLLLYINAMRAINYRFALPDLRADIEASGSEAARIAFIECLVELANIADAMSLMVRWQIDDTAISESSRQAIILFRTRQKSLRASTDQEFTNWLLTRVSQQSSRLVRPASDARRRRIMIMASSLGMGGAERQLAHLLSYLNGQSAECEVLVLVGHRRTELNFGDNKYIEIKYRGELGRSVRHKTLAHSIPRYVLNDIEIGLKRPYFGSILHLAAEFQPDTVYNSIGLPTDAILVGILTGATNIIVRFGGLSFENSYDASDQQRIQTEIAERLCSLVAHRITFLTNSYAGQQAWSRRLQLPEANIRVVYNGTSFSSLLPQSARDAKKKELFDRPDVIVLGFVGRFHDVKRPFLWMDIALHLAASHPDLRFLMVGDGALRSAIEAKAAASGHRSCFAFTGAVSEGLGDLYQAMDLFLLTSRTESFPNVVVEALGYGVFVVSGAVGDVPRVLRSPEAGAVVESNDFAEFVSTFESVLPLMPELTRTRERRALDARQRFDVPTMLKEYKKVL